MGSSANKAYKRLLQERLQHFIASVRGKMRTAPEPWHTLAHTMLDNVGTQFHELSSFIQQFYAELTQVSKFQDARAWTLVGRCVGAVFEDQRRYRANAEKVGSLSQASAKAQVLGAVLKSHAVMDDFLQAGFRSHPLIVKEISLFMLRERVDPVDLASVQSEVEKFKSELKKLQTANTELKKIVGDQKEEVKRLKDRVVAQEKRK